MKIQEYVCRVETTVVFTREEIAILMQASKGHYDHKCKMLGEVGGLVYGLNNILRFDEGLTEVSRTCKNDDLQSLAKVTEPFAVPEFGPLHFSLMSILKDNLNHQQLANKLLTCVTESTNSIF